MGAHVPERQSAKRRGSSAQSRPITTSIGRMHPNTPKYAPLRPITSGAGRGAAPAPTRPPRTAMRPTSGSALPRPRQQSTRHVSNPKLVSNQNHPKVSIQLSRHPGYTAIAPTHRGAARVGSALSRQRHSPPPPPRPRPYHLRRGRGLAWRVGSHEPMRKKGAVPWQYSEGWVPGLWRAAV